MALTYEKVVQEDLDLGTSTGQAITTPSGGSTTGTQIGLHTFSVGLTSLYVTWDPGSLASLAYEAKTFAFAGAATTDIVDASLSTILTNDMMLTAHVSAANQVTAILFNSSGGTVDVGSGTLTVLVYKVRSTS